MTTSFDGRRLSSDGGALFLREIGDVPGVMRWLAGRFPDRRGPERTLHGRDCLVAQRVIATAPGCEDINDHDQLRNDGELA